MTRTTNDDENQQQGFETEAVAPHATFSDDVAAAFGVTFEEGCATKSYAAGEAALITG